MRNNKRYITRLALGLTLLLAGLAACEPSPSPTPSATPSPGPPRKATATPELSVSTIRQACQAQSERGREKQSRRPGNLEVPPYQDLLYLEGHVIVTGPENDIDEAIRALGLELEQLELE